MPLLGVNLTEITAKRKKPATGKINININMGLTGVEKKEGKIPGKSTLVVSFAFDTLYEPEIGSIRVEGEALVLEENKDADKFMAAWKKDKKLPDKDAVPIMNAIITRSNVEAILLGRELGLPPTIKMPEVKIK